MTSRKGSFMKTTTSSFYLKPLDKISVVDDLASDQSHSNQTTSRFEHSPHHAQSPNSSTNGTKPPLGQYIFLNRKKTMDFLMTDNLLRHNQTYGKSSFSGASGLKLSGIESFNTTPRQPQVISPLHSPKMKSSTAYGTTFPSIDKRLEKLSDSVSKEVFQDLLSAGEKVPKFVSPLSPKSLINHKACTSRDKTMQIIQNHNHRIYGMDLLNLKKINTMLKSKVETPKSGLGSSPSHLSLSRVHSTKIAEMRAEEENILKDYNTYEYNPLLDGFQFSGADMSELESLLTTLTSPSKDTTTIPPRAVPSFKKRLKTKSQTMAPEEILINPPMSAHSASPKVAQETPRKVAAKPSVFTKKRKGSTGIGAGEDDGAVHTVGYNSARISLKPKAPEETLDEQNKKIIAQTYRRHDNGVHLLPSPKNASVKDNMKNLQNLCGTLEAQNKKIMNAFKHNKKEIGDHYNNLNKRVSSFLEGPVTESLLASNT